MKTVQHNNAISGVLFALGGYAFWGFVPFYFKAVGHIQPLEVLSHRIIWSVIFLLPLLLIIQGSLRGTLKQLFSKKQLLASAVSSIFLSINWFLFIWAIQNNRVLDASLGYFITPLISIFLGIIFLRERQNSLQSLSIALAVLGVLNLIIARNGFPWLPIMISITFSLYGFCRKKSGVEPMSGLVTETILMCPIALLYLVFLNSNGSLAFLHAGPLNDTLLILAGIVTSLPLVLFLEGIKRIRLSTIGIMQYVSPSVQFLLATQIFHETLSEKQIVTFALIWCGIAIYVLNSLRRPSLQKAD